MSGINSIEEFASIEKGSDYYQKLLEELAQLNEKLHAFSNINSSINSFPFSAKDNLCVKGVETTASSKILDGYIPPYNATVVERLLNNGFSFLGKTNMDEFGFGSFGINAHEIARNPFDERYVAGGSSSGAAVATSILKYHVAIAESTGGSIATPASFCGVVGFTPTYSTISRYGLIDYSNSMDKIGIMARTAKDIRPIFDLIRGPDGYDSTTSDSSITSINKKKLIVIDQLLDLVDQRIRELFEKMLDKLNAKGYTIEHRSIDLIDASIASYYIIAMAEASTNLARYTGFKYGFKIEDFDKGYNEFFTEARSVFGEEAKRRILLGTFVRSANVKDKYYFKALKVRDMLSSRLEKILEEGFIILPVMPIPTPKIEDAKKLTPLQVYKMDALTIPPNLCGLPHISFPYAYDNGLPLGAEVITSKFNDYAIIDFVEEWEEDFEYKFKYNIGEIK
ncbi:MAG: amidase family protein [Candidatus Micrarchaeota archaeon]